MLKIGLTGGIGSGKSLICKVFKRLGIAIYDADNAVKYLYDTDAQLQADMTELFGNELYKSGKLDRKMLASIIFTNPKAMSEMASVVYPAVGRDFMAWANTQINSPYVVLEGAVLFESGLQYIMDKVISVSAPEEVRIKRTILRDGVDYEDIKRRINNQMSNEERNKLANYIIISDNITPILPQILTIHNQLISLNP